MKSTRKKTNYRVPELTILCGLMSFAGPARCDGPPANVPLANGTPLVQAAEVQPDPKAGALLASEIDQDAALQVRVSLTSKAEPLTEVLLDLQKQSKVALTLSPGDSVAPLRVTAFIQALPLSQVLAGLSRLYGVWWTKTDANAFVMHSSDPASLETQLLQLGILSKDRLRHATALLQNRDRPNWAREVLKYTNEETLKSDAGESASVLPADLLAKIRAEVEEKAAFHVVGSQYALMEASIDDGILQATVPKTKKGAAVGKPPAPPQIVVQTTDGRSVPLSPSEPLNPKPEPPQHGMA